MSGSAIGGNLETSVIFDVSGIRTGAERGAQALQEFQNSAERVATDLRDVGAATDGTLVSLERAAGLVEVLTLKMLAMDRASSGRTGATNRIAAWQSWIAEEAGFLQKIHVQVAQEREQEFDSLRRDIEQRLSLQQRYRDQWAAEEAGFLQRIHVQAEQERSQEMAALRRDIEQRNAARVQGARDWVTDQARLLATERQQAEQERSQEMADLRRDIESRHIARVQAEQNWIADQSRLLGIERANAETSRARELADLRRDIDQRNAARVRGEQEWIADQARLLAIERQMLDRDRALELANLRTAIERRHTVEQAGTLGLRRFSFGAQQFGYAIEDAASVYGMTGLAGSFRAAGNNLTAMAAAAGPWIGVAASLTAAAAAIGLHLWDSAKAAEEARESETKLAEQRSRALAIQQNLISHERTLIGLRGASKLGFGSVLSEQSRASDEDLAERRLNQRGEAVRKAEAEIAAQQREVDRLRAVADPQDLSAIGDENQRIYLQAKQRLEVMQQGLRGLQAEEGAHLAMMESAGMRAAQRAVQREEMLQRSVELRNEGVRKALTPEVAQTEVSIQAEARRLEAERLNLLERRYDTEADMLQALQMHEDIMQRQIDLAGELQRVREQGVISLREANQLFTQRFEALNPELAIENDILRTRKELEERMRKAVEAGKMQVQDVAKYRAELERVFSLEADRRQREKRIEQLHERQKLLEDVLRNSTPAGLTSAVVRGSEEDLRILEQDRLVRMGLNKTDPVVSELQQIKAEVKAQKEALQKIAGQNPGVAAIL